MAFEDRCSPQSAPSPPGVPHSPHHNSTMIFTDINTNSTSNSGLPSDPQMALDVCSTDGDERCSPVIVKQENENNTMNQQEAPITFSINNILSNNFGKINRKSSTDRKATLFRPYDNESSTTTTTTNDIQSATGRKKPHATIENASPFSIQSKLNGVIDFSNRANILLQNNTIEHTKLLNLYNHHQSQFNLAAMTTLYPRSHEDILSNKTYQQYYQPTQMLPDSALSKIPPLGNLCKTVSQIGQPVANKSLTTHQAKKIDQETTPTATVVHQREQQQKIQQASSLDSGMESSDDTKSETGSTKEDGNSQNWPAWIYCTRYSDRPSSGTHHFVYSILYLFFYYANCL